MPTCTSMKYSSIQNSDYNEINERLQDIIVLLKQAIQVQSTLSGGHERGGTPGSAYAVRDEEVKRNAAADIIRQGQLSGMCIQQISI